MTVRRALKIAGALVLLAVLGVFGWVVRGNAVWRKHYDAPYPPIHADASPAALKRGGEIFAVKCEGCHRAQGAAHVAGRRMDDLPAFFGAFYAANITRDPRAGAGALRDEQIARVIRYGVTHDGRRSVMGWALSDADLAAIIGYLRSNAPELEPDPAVQPRSKPSVMGAAILGNSLGAPRPLPASGIKTPPRSDTVAYGRYMAVEAFDCAFCHTAGFAPDKAQGKQAYAGGFTFTGSDGKPIVSQNITFDPSGIQGWTQAQFVSALQDGVTPGGAVLRDPMPRFRSADPSDLQAIYAFLKTVPPHAAVGHPIPSPVAPVAPAPPEPSPAPSVAAAQPPLDAPPPQAERAPRPAAQLFHDVGCYTCHGQGAAFHSKLADARNQSVDDIAAWIRHPEKVKPGTQMPTFARIVTPTEAHALAMWIKAGNPKSPADAGAKRGR